MGEAVISLGLYDQTAKPDATISVTFGNALDPEMLQDPCKIGFKPRNYASLEKDYFKLDGSFELFPDDLKPGTAGLWLSGISNESGSIQAKRLNIQFSKTHSSAGLTITFIEDYPEFMRVAWIDASGEILTDRIFFPDALTYLCECPIDGYQQIVIIFSHTTKPYRRIKIANIEFGLNKVFSGEDISVAKIVEECDPLSSQLAIGKLDFTLLSESKDFDIYNPQGLYKMFRTAQPVVVSYLSNGEARPFGTYYLESWESGGDNTASFQAVDALGLLDKTTFWDGQVYSRKPADEVLDEIMQSAGFENYEMDPALAKITVSGWLPICTHREALQQLCFSIGAMCNTSREGAICVTKLSDDILGTMERSRRLLGYKTTLGTYVSDVELTSHNYYYNQDITELHRETFGAGRHTIELKGPQELTDAGAATIIKSTCNYAVIDVPPSAAGTETVLSGHQYSDVSPVIISRIETLPAGEVRNTVKVEDATLHIDDLLQTTADQVLAFNQWRYISEIPFILQDERVGTWITIENESMRFTKNYCVRLSIDLAKGLKTQGTYLSSGEIWITENYLPEMYSGENLGVV